MDVTPPLRRWWRWFRAWDRYTTVMARRAVGYYAAKVWKWRAEAAQALGLLAGWALLLHGLALLLPGRAAVVRTLGVAVLVLGLVGLKWIAVLFHHGLYSATVGGDDERPPGPGPTRRLRWPAPVVNREDEGEE